MDKPESGTDIHYTWRKDPKTGKLHQAGRFITHKGQLRHLEDYHGLLQKEIPEGEIDEVTAHQMHSPGSGLIVASHKAIRAGHRLDVVPEDDSPPLPNDGKPVQVDHATPQAPQRPASVWNYLRAGHDKPHTLEVKDGQHLLDGNPLEPHEVSTILDNVRTKVAKIRYPNGVKALTAADRIAKMEAKFALLAKSDFDAQGALQHLESLGLTDEKSQAAVASLRRHVFEDPMVPGLGNKYAYSQFQQSNPQGVSVVGDANNFKGINDVHGHEAGDSAIKALGGAWRDAANEVGDGKAHRFGGDEFHVHFPTHEHAAQFARNLRGKLEGMPAVGGTHKLSMSLGIGQDFNQADKAVYSAKLGKQGTTPATIPSVLAHSLHPQATGPVPTSPPATGLTPPSPAAKLPAPAPAMPTPASPAAPTLPAPPT